MGTLMRDYRFKPYEPDKPLVLPPDIRKWLPDDHLALFISDVVDSLDLTAITEQYDRRHGGQPAYHPAMMLKLLFYGYCVGVRSSRRIERKTYEDVAFRVLSCDCHPDHSRISDFRKRHLKDVNDLFLQVLRICEEMSLVKLGAVALDGSKIKANASKHKSMSYGRMKSREKELQAEVERLLGEAAHVDQREDRKFGKGVRGDELPKELQFKQSRLEKIRSAKCALEEETRREAECAGKSDKDNDDTPGGTSGKRTGAKKEPEDKKQRNFTDPDSRIMLDGATKAFQQAYNGQAAVDCDSQVIVGAGVTRDANDKRQVIPMLAQIEENVGQAPDRFLADNGYFSEENVQHVAANHIEAFIAAERFKHTDPPPPSPRGRIPKNLGIVDRMRRKLRTKKGKQIYSKRKESVEAVFGQIKEVRGIRSFLLRGIQNVQAEWDLICLTHNILKLWGHFCPDGRRIAPAFC